MVNHKMIQNDGSHNQQAGRDIINNFKIEEIEKKPTRIAKIISLLSQEITDEIPDDYSAINFYDIADKISFNNVKKYKEIIDRYGFFGSIIENICNKLDTDKPNSKSRMFEYIKFLYIEEKNKICVGLNKEKCLEKIKENADNIIDAIRIKLIELINKSKGLDDVNQDDIDISLVSLVAVAFINCKILEKPE